LSETPPPATTERLHARLNGSQISRYRAKKRLASKPQVTGARWPDA
jgi:hypothetical protein